MMEKINVFALKKNITEYPKNINPSRRYPEYKLKEMSKENKVYNSVRDLLYNMGLDKNRYGTSKWNPLGNLIKPGQTVVIKPNLVDDFNPIENDMKALVTNGSIIRAIVDYCYIALKGKGKLVIGDAPLQKANFDRIKEFNKLDEIKNLYKKEKDFNIEILDFRKEICERNNPLNKIYQKGDPKGYTIIDLKKNSFHNDEDIDYKRYRVTDYNPNLMIKCHNKNHHKYLISNTILSADVIINLPKLKTHRKAGMTCALKNLVGINCLKDYLPHHKKGSKKEKGDEYLYKDFNKMSQSSLLDIKNRTNPNKKIKLMLINWIMRINQKIIKLKEKDSFFEGSWYGNDTIWRTILDLNRILLYVNKKRIMTNKKQRKMFILVDGIIAGEKEAPLEPTSKKCGLLLAGFNPVSIDYVASAFMGFDYLKIPQIKNAFDIARYPLINLKQDNIQINLNGKKIKIKEIKKNNFAFIPAKGWEASLYFKRKP